MQLGGQDRYTKNARFLSGPAQFQRREHVTEDLLPRKVTHRQRLVPF
jgi:hypothetical protein